MRRGVSPVSAPTATSGDAEIFDQFEHLPVQWLSTQPLPDL
jgi:hypothetical protein